MSTGDHPVPVHMSESPERHRQPRNFMRCQKCRKDRKRCTLDDPTLPDSACTRCLRKRWRCSGQVRAQNTHNTPGAFLPKRITILAARLLLRSCLDANRRLKDLIYPWPTGTSGEKPKSSTLQRDFGLLASRLDLQMRELDTILNQLGGCDRSLESDPVQNAQQIVDGSAPFRACIEHIKLQGDDGEASGRVSRVASGVSPSPNHYILLSNTICQLLCTHCPGTGGSSNTGTGSFVSINKGLPPSHVAYLNGNKDMAVDLWCWAVCQSYSLDQTQTVHADLVVDLIGRTFPQLVAEAGDFETLRKIADRGGDTMLHANHDGRGLSLLALAMCAPAGPDFEVLDMLLSQRPWALSRQHGPEPSIIDLALLSRNWHVVRWILGQRVACESFEGYVEKAIELAEANIALLFIPWLEEAERVNQGVVNELADLAEEKYRTWTESLNDGTDKTPEFVHKVRCWREGFPQLVVALRKIVVRPTTQRQIIADITTCLSPDEDRID